MKILMVASEAVPFAKTGGLADVAGVLPKVLTEMGHDVRLVMPRYYAISRSELKPLDLTLGVPMGIIGEQWAGVYEGRLPDSEVPVYFFEHEGYYGRSGLYNEEDGAGFLDNDNRFVFLSRAALQVCKALHFQPDVVHCNDWHTAVIPLLLNTVYRHDPVLWQTASVLTIHNMEYQGEFFSGLMDVLGVGWEHFNPLGLECNGRVNLLKGGIYHATQWNAVSPKYAREIQTPQFGHGLEGVAIDRSRDLRGILNGIDYTEWNPGVDRHIAATYTADDKSGKAVCKAALQREMGLPVRDDVPLVGIISRLVHQKGVDLLARAMPQILDLDLQFVLLGSGEPEHHEFFSRLSSVRHDKFAAHIGYNNPLAHRIEAGSDLYIMPSRFEPCGLNQLYSLSYGTLPIVHAVGGLDDTVENYDQVTGEGTGFKFWDLHPRAIFDTIGWAVHAWYERKEQFAGLVDRAMRQRFSWEDSASQYVEMYGKAVRNRTGRAVFTGSHSGGGR